MGRLIILFTLFSSAAFSKSPEGMVDIPSGSYLPLYTVNGQKISVAGFKLDKRPVTNSQYLAFVTTHPEWRRNSFKKIFAEKGYLKHWKANLEVGSADLLKKPVVFVSWFAASAYCESQGKSLPTVDQWEYVASVDVSDPEIKKRLVEWYSRPTDKSDAAPHVPYINKYGVEDLLGLVWEWTLDFNTAMVSGESRGDSDVEKNLYCGGGAAGAADFKDYAAFMRYAYRSSLKANYTTANLGFRCAKKEGL